MNKLFTQIVEQRHYSDLFLHPRYEDLSDPFLLPDMREVTKRIRAALAAQEKILIYGDYDVDGVTASTLMASALELAGCPSPEIMLPDRFIDGYGMSSRVVERAIEGGFTLVITVDCGSSNHDIIDALRSHHIDTIVTDHHECGDTLPSAIAVVNPKRTDFTGPAALRDLAGVGVAFEVAAALVREHLIPSGQEKWLLDLVLLGTVCDNMTISEENRILSYYGLKVIGKTRRPGLEELIRSSSTKVLNSETVGFQLGPRLNAAGRLASATLSLDLLRTTSATTAVALAAQLEELNRERRNTQFAITSEITARGIGSDPVIVVAGPWHEGLIGIIAGRLVEQYQRPAFVLAELADGTLKGSGRSFGDFNLAAALDYARGTITGGGGHASAAGVKLPREHLAAFREAVNTYYRSLHLIDQAKYLRLQPDLTFTSLADFSLDLLDDLSTLEPYGPGNTEPIFQLDGASIVSTRRMGSEGQHLRLDVRDTAGYILKLVAFSAPASWASLDSSTPHSFLIRPVANEWQGIRSIEGRLLDIL